jgi:S-adenosylmethionine hydrolase
MKPILVFQTDFTYKEGAVSSMYGVVKSVDRELEIFDGTHELRNTIHGARAIASTKACVSGRKARSMSPWSIPV